MHRLELIDGAPAVSLFFTGPKVREWGFDTVCGWRHWQDCPVPGDPGIASKIPTRLEEC